MSGTIKRSETIKGLKRTLSRLDLRPSALKAEEAMQQKRAGRVSSLEGLHKLWCALQPLDHAHLNEEDLKDLDIEVLDLETSDNKSDAARRSRFFNPSPPSVIEEHPIDPDDPENRIGILVMKDIAKYDPFWSNSPYDVAGSLSSVLEHGFVLRRVGKGKNIRLREMSPWKKAPFFPSVFNEAFADDIVLNRTMELQGAWHAQDPTLKPHVMIAIAQEAAGIHDEFLRTELLTITAIMLSRLMNDRFENHTIIPVMLFSFMGNSRGRILQACFTKDKLIIRKSKLYDFSTPEKANASLEQFLRYMVSELVGNTAPTPTLTPGAKATTTLPQMFNPPSIRKKASGFFGKKPTSG